MHILILGGTLFLGRHLVESALAHGHRVTLFNRGTRSISWPGVAQLKGDRDGGLEALDGHRFDVAIDTSGYVPRLVGASARRLADVVEHYTFVSSASVYADLSQVDIDESAEVQTIDDPASEDVRANYGALKALCEKSAEDAMPGRVLHVRAGLIVGPFDPTGRFAYWVRRVADGGDVLAPGDPDRPVQLIHARDLANWIVKMAEARRSGVYNATGPANHLSMLDLLRSCREASGSNARFVWVDDGFLGEQGVAEFTDLPLWLTAAEHGLLALDVSKAVADGLSFRPLTDTAADAADWLRTGVAVSPATLASGVSTQAGLAPDRERAILAAWAARQR